MAIENDPKIKDHSDELRRIVEYAERQAQLQKDQDRQLDQQQLQAREALRTQEEKQLDPTQRATQEPQLDEAQRERNAQDIQAQIQTRQVAQVNETRETSGQEKSDEAVGAASTQQDRAERWQAFAADANKPTVIPPSVEAQVAEQQQEERRREQQKLSVADLLKQMAIKGGKIDA